MLSGIPLSLLWPIVLLAGFIGAAGGSFAAVVLSRRGTGESSLTGRSHCVCGSPIPMWWNVPVVSYVLLRGRSRCCGAAIPRWYLLFEMASGLGAAVLVATLGLWGLPAALVALAGATALFVRVDPPFAR